MAMISPSILTADIFVLEKYIEIFEKCGVEMLHLDVMDGQFVPNISFGPPIISAIKKHTSLPLDVHLMIDRPHRYTDVFARDADFLGFHYEAGSDPRETLEAIKAAGCKPCLTIKPKTPAEEIFPLLPLCDMVLVMSVEPGFGGQKFMPDSCEKISALKAEREKRGLSFLIEIDGGINAETAPVAVAAGADVLVAGNFLFSAKDVPAAVKSLKSL